MTFGQVRFRLTKLYPGIDPDSLDGFINEAFRSIMDRTNWKLLEAEGTINTVAPYETGSIALTAGSLAIVGTGTVWTTAMTGRGVYIPGRNESYRFTFTDATHGSLDRAYEGSAAAASSYKLYQDIYELPYDYRRPLVSRNERLPGVIEHRARNEMDGLLPTRLQFGEPQFYSLVTPGPLVAIDAEEDNDRRRAQLYPIPAYAAGYPYTYIRAAAEFAEGFTETVIPQWCSPKAVVDLTRAGIEGAPDRKNYAGMAAFTASAEREIVSMLMADAAVRGPQKLRMAGKYTRHRLDRAMRGAGSYGRRS